MFSGKSIRTAAACACLLWGAGAPLAEAGTVRFELRYSGADFGNDASAGGHVTFDDAKLPNRAANLPNATATDLGIVDFSLSLAGLYSGNDTFGLSDYATGWVWRLSAPVDFGRDLVGQAGFVDFNFCATPNDCTPWSMPLAFAPQVIASNYSEAGLLMRLVSMRAAAPASNDVPEPHSLALAGLGLLGLAAARRRAQG